MKKQYIAPEMEVVSVNPSSIINTSMAFGSDSTDVMHSRLNLIEADDDASIFWE